MALQTVRRGLDLLLALPLLFHFLRDNPQPLHFAPERFDMSNDLIVRDTAKWKGIKIDRRPQPLHFRDECFCNPLPIGIGVVIFSAEDFRLNRVEV